MKKTSFTLILFSLLAFTAKAQVPQAFSYQAVVRDATGQILANQNVGLKIDLIQFDTVYTETHTATTNAFGLVNLEVGRGTAQLGRFDTIDWSLEAIYIQVSLDATGGSNYETMGFSELLSVPYALYTAQSAEESGLPADAQTGDLLYYDGTAWQWLPAGAPGDILTMGADGLPAWRPIPSLLDTLLRVILPNGDAIYVSPEPHGPFPTGTPQWGGFGITIPNLPYLATEDAARMDFDGETNTAAIVAHLGNNDGILYAAKLCADLIAYGFNDWYLPAGGELNAMYQQLGPINNGGGGQMMTGIYWSSSHSSFLYAWAQEFDNGNQYPSFKDELSGCRCVRK